MGDEERIDELRRLLVEIQRGEKARDQTTGKLEGIAEGLGFRQSELFDLIRRLPCSTHEATMAAIMSRLDKLDGQVPRTPRPPTSPGQPALTRADLDNTERTVLERSAEQVEAAIAAKLQAGVEAVLDKRAADAERVAAERREATRREQEAQAAKLAADLVEANKQKAEHDKARWKRVEWAVGLVGTILTSGTVISHCNTKEQMAQDRQATSAQMARDREAVVQQLKSIPGEVVKKVEPALAPAAPKEEK